MDPSQLVRDAIGSLTAANVAIRFGRLGHAIGQLNAVEANLAELRRAVEEKLAEAEEASS